MRDGIELAADVYLPAGAEEKPVPAIVTVTPYGKEGETLVGDEALLYQSHGYAFVAADVRGRGKSEGDWLAFVNDAKDTHDVIEWAAAQPWCNGKVGHDRAQLHGLGAVGRGVGAAAAPARDGLHVGRRALAAGDPVHQRCLPALLRLVGLLPPGAGSWISTGSSTPDWNEILRTLPFEGYWRRSSTRTGPNWDDLCAPRHPR